MAPGVCDLDHGKSIDGITIALAADANPGEQAKVSVRQNPLKQCKVG
jgi:hypothetical protein